MPYRYDLKDKTQCTTLATFDTMCSTCVWCARFKSLLLQDFNELQVELFVICIYWERQTDNGKRAGRHLFIKILWEKNLTGFILAAYDGF